MKHTSTQEEPIAKDQLIRLLLTLQEDAVSAVEKSTDTPEILRLSWLGKNSEFAKLAALMKTVKAEDKQQIGAVLNGVKQTIEHALSEKMQHAGSTPSDEWFDPTMPGEQPPEGHLHIVSQAISEITSIFNRLGFTRVRHPEVDWDWYAFTALNMPSSHPARDEWETFFIEGNKKNEKFNKIVLTPHTSNGQVREMEKGTLPIRMINIAKCYRRQIDVSHTPMFHQFEGLYIDKNVSIAHLKGVLDYFAKHFFGPDRQTRIRPYHFQFTEPSFEIDVSCGVCHGKGCKLCKEGWLELGGAGMVHPNVLKSGNVDTATYNGFAFGWGVERTYMMKANTKLDDIRMLYSNDVRFLSQF